MDVRIAPFRVDFFPDFLKWIRLAGVIVQDDMITVLGEAMCNGSPDSARGASEMDWQEDKLSARFVFKNPNITEQCGCGESFSVS